MTLGHPTLVGGGNVRLAGELVSSGNGWVLNNQSGRYMLGVDVNSSAFQNAVNLFKQRGINITGTDLGGF